MYGTNSRARRRRTRIGVESLEGRQMLTTGPGAATSFLSPTQAITGVSPVSGLNTTPVTGDFSPAQVQQMESQGDDVSNTAVQAQLAQGFVAVSSPDRTQWSFVPKNGGFLDLTPTFVLSSAGVPTLVSSEQNLKSAGYTLVSYPDGNQWYALPSPATTTGTTGTTGTTNGPTGFVPGVILEAELQAMRSWALTHGGLPAPGTIPALVLNAKEVQAGNAAQNAPAYADVMQHLFTVAEQAYEAAHGLPHNQAEGTAEVNYIESYQYDYYAVTAATWTDPDGVWVMPTELTDGFATITGVHYDPDPPSQNQDRSNEGFSFNVLLSGDDNGDNLRKFLADHTWAQVLVDAIAIVPSLALGGWEAAIPLTVEALGSVGVDASATALSITAEAAADEDIWAVALSRT